MLHGQIVSRVMREKLGVGLCDAFPDGDLLFRVRIGPFWVASPSSCDPVLPFSCGATLVILLTITALRIVVGQLPSVL